MSVIKLFPLSSVVLPEGRMNIRIFEPRYKRMISESCKAGLEFGVSLIGDCNSASAGCISNVGTMAKIIDFDQLSDGFLGVTIVGTHRFKINRIWSEFDGLRCAEIEYLSNWNSKQLSDKDLFISSQLQRVYQRFPEIKDLYSHCFFDDAAWVSQRWLELLPLEQVQFEHLISQGDCEEAVRFLCQAIEV
ncbi:ATP-dependent protease [Vibrio sp. UCD-FRSSP16_10]|uniref:LON peptidase substrate-binding domain-containing protein n=1 Tax=unclassified Vibrio TaxID=2614977 RepID=UPI0008003BBE|nr:MULTISPECIES: LON peptidase substrate-binding domain-containing protein [unclassified Vibrio]OBT06560.1 ATP-dependent protease [Vibrio sp. UCD-FRSSP16_30]OBT12257.1 ATP-dependent protease [Vibrio sp. UCD-FRSSP16_10]